MKYSRPVIAGIILTVAALLLVLIGNLAPDDPASDGAANSSSGTAAANPTDAPAGAARPSRLPRTREPAEPPDAKELKLLWARGRSQELLVALDELSQKAKAEDWNQVASVLIEQAASDGRPEVATYLLATGHGAPDGIRLAIYAAALDNPDGDIRDSAKLELLNLTGEDFASSADANRWIAAHPEAARNFDLQEE